MKNAIDALKNQQSALESAIKSQEQYVRDARINSDAQQRKLDMLKAELKDIIALLKKAWEMSVEDCSCTSGARKKK